MNHNKTKINDNVIRGKRILCQIKELGSCFGCCGNHFKSEELVMAGIRKNNDFLKKMIEKHEGNWDSVFIDMNTNYYGLRKCGVCYSLINLKEFPGIEKFYDIFPKESVESDKIFGCPMHPILQGEEKRICEIDHECKAYSLFKNWDVKKQDSFIEFLKKKKLNVYNFSMGFDDNSFIDEFLKL